jgi:hypothetical protein
MIILLCLLGAGVLVIPLVVVLIEATKPYPRVWHTHAWKSATSRPLTERLYADETVEHYAYQGMLRPGTYWQETRQRLRTIAESHKNEFRHTEQLQWIRRHEQEVTS